MIDLTTNAQISELSDSSKALLAKVDDYVLDYNIFLFKGMREIIASHDERLKSIIQSLFLTLPEEYSAMIFNPMEKSDGKIEPSTTSKLQDRLLSLLIQERHRRDIDVLNSRFENKIKYIELGDPFKYEIKSPFYKTFNESKEDYGEQFNKLALLQSLEYDFEHVMDEESDYQSDDDLVGHFCDDSVVDFKLDASKTDADVMDSEIVRVLLPLASQVILSENDEDEVEEKPAF